MSEIVAQAQRSPIMLPQSASPQLAVVVDTEEQFDWAKPFSRANISVSHMRSIGLAQSLFEKYGVTPTYVIDYAIASHASGYGPLKELAHDSRAEIGAHLHPWVTPPFEEPVGSFHSYGGNLPESLEREKLRILCERIEESLGQRPRIFRAGRYGLGPHSFQTISDLGFEVDTSPSPGFDFSDDGGPDYSEFPIEPFWWRQPGGLLCVPYSGALVGHLPQRLKLALSHNIRRNGRFGALLGVLSRAKLLSRIRLTPEGFRLAEMRSLTKFLLDSGVRIFVLGFHSPTIEPGHTSYAKTILERDRFLDRLREYFDFFFGALGGRPTTLSRFRESLLS